MVKSSDSGQHYNISVLDGLHSPKIRCIFVQRQVSSGDVVIVEVIAKDSAQVPLVENYHVIEALSANRSDNTFHIRVLPGRSRRCDDLVYAQVLDTPLHLFAIDRIPIA